MQVGRWEPVGGGQGAVLLHLSHQGFQMQWLPEGFNQGDVRQ